MTVLLRLDAKRKYSVLQFLYESGLIDKDKCIIELSGANLGEAILIGADLHGANLPFVKVRDEQLKQAKSLAGATMPDGSKHP